LLICLEFMGLLILLVRHRVCSN